MSKHRAASRALRRRGRAGAMGLALGVTIVIGGATLVPQLSAGSATAGVGSSPGAATDAAALETAAFAPVVQEPAVADAVAAPEVVEVPDPEVPADSGEGRRIVFDEGDQRVWLVDGDETVERTYLVSGSRFDNLDPGTY
ncbi:MAG: hypothetical protein ABWZ87_09075, partial [Aeromicrobium sp.]